MPKDEVTHLQWGDLEKNDWILLFRKYSLFRVTKAAWLTFIRNLRCLGKKSGSRYVKDENVFMVLPCTGIHSLIDFFFFRGMQIKKCKSAITANGSCVLVQERFQNERVVIYWGEGSSPFNEYHLKDVNHLHATFRNSI